MPYTLVQHSGFGYGSKLGFEHGVEVRRLAGDREVALVRQAGGVIYVRAEEAERAACAANYPAGEAVPYPYAAGTFARQMIDGLRIYVPAAPAEAPRDAM